MTSSAGLGLVLYTAAAAAIAVGYLALAALLLLTRYRPQYPATRYAGAAFVTMIGLRLAGEAVHALTGGNTRAAVQLLLIYHLPLALAAGGFTYGVRREIRYLSARLQLNWERP